MIDGPFNLETYLPQNRPPAIVAIQAANARLETRSEVMARGRVYGGWSNLWRVVEFRAGGRIYGAWLGSGQAVEFRAGGGTSTIVTDH